MARPRRSGAIQPGDRVVYYSPTSVLPRPGQIAVVYGHRRCKRCPSVSGGYGRRLLPFRRDVDWCAAREAPIKPLVGRLQFTSRRNWGFQLRFGLFEISGDDMAMIAEAMGASLTPR